MSKTEVIILSTLHGFHKDNPLYSFEDIYKFIDYYKPDCIGVEIREEDMGQSREYLSNYYPYEMIETKFRYQDKCSVYGFDYYEESVEGKLIPEDYFDRFELPKLQQAFETDEAFEKERKLLDVINSVRMELIPNRSAAEINDGKYDIASKIYYNQLEVLLKDTPYEKMSYFYKNRDQHIDDNIIKIINNNEGKKLMFLMGLDHRVFAVDAIKKTLGDCVILTDIVENDKL